MKGFVTAGLAVLGCVAQAQVRYTVVDLGTLDGLGASARKINELGHVVGISANMGFRWDPQRGTMVALRPAEGAPTARANNINDSLQAIGMSDRNWGRPTLWNADANPQVILDPPPNEIMGGLSINDHGQIVGHKSIGFLREPNGAIRSLGKMYPGHVASYPEDINNHTVIVGQSFNADHAEAFRWTYARGMEALERLQPDYETIPHPVAINNNNVVAGWYVKRPEGNPNGLVRVPVYWTPDKKIHEIINPEWPGYGAMAHDINDLFQIVGTGYGPFDRAWMWSPATGFVVLQDHIPADSGWRLRIAYGINNNGEIVGEGVKDEQNRAFLLRPIVTGPALQYIRVEPSSVRGGDPVSVTLSLNARATADTPVATGDNSTVIFMPDLVTIRAGNFGQRFTVRTQRVTSNSTRMVFARRGHVTRSAALTLTP